MITKFVYNFNGNWIEISEYESKTKTDEQDQQLVNKLAEKLLYE